MHDGKQDEGDGGRCGSADSTCGANVGTSLLRRRVRRHQTHYLDRNGHESGDGQPSRVDLYRREANRWHGQELGDRSCSPIDVGGERYEEEYDSHWARARGDGLSCEG